MEGTIRDQRNPQSRMRMIVVSGSGHTSEVSSLLPAPPPHPKWDALEGNTSQEYTGQKPGRAENLRTLDNICVYVFMCVFTCMCLDFPQQIAHDGASPHYYDCTLV